MKASFQDRQCAFASYIRNPKTCAIPDDVNAERIAVYSELFFNNIDGFLASCFPVLKTLLDDNQWRQLTRDFFATHHCKTPYFSEIAQEFLEYLQNERDTSDDYPFINELAHYEWVEMALSIATDELIINNTIDNLINKRLSMSSLAWVLAYQYPVHKISPDYIPHNPPTELTFLIVHRDSDDNVHFFTITALTYRLLSLIEEQAGLTTQDYLIQLTQEIGQANAELIISNGLQILSDLARKNIIVID
jgi:hypothetical protein